MALPNRHRLARFACAAALVAIEAALGWNPVDGATVQQRFDAPHAVRAQVATVRDTELEEVFWLCDHAAAVGTVDASERAVCAAVTEQLRMERFGGDFEQMLRWWRANKIIEHRRLDRDDGSSAAE